MQSGVTHFVISFPSQGPRHASTNVNQLTVEPSCKNFQYTETLYTVSMAVALLGALVEETQKWPIITFHCQICNVL